MDAHALVYHLEQLAEKLGVEVRYEDLEGEGGLCEMKGRKILFVNGRCADIEKSGLMARELSRFETEHMYLLPEVREALEEYRKR